MPKKTPDYDNVFKTMKMKHKRLFVSVINDVFGKDYPLNVKVDVLPSEGYLTENETADGNKEIKEQISHDDVTSTNFNGDYCAGYIVYTGKVDEWADGYTFFKLVDRIDGAEKVFVGKKIDGDLKPEEDEDEDEEDDENKEENE